MARRGDEKTIKVSADVADLQRAFENVERAYADVSKASGDYARAVEASAKAVTDDEKAIAKEVEKTTKAILQATKQRAAAYKSQASAIKTQVDAVKQKVTATDADTDAQGKNTKAAMAGKVAFVALGMAVLGAATKFADMTRKVAESNDVSAVNQQQAQRMVGSLDSIASSANVATLGFMNFVAAVGGLRDAEHAVSNFDRSMKEIALGWSALAMMAREGIGVDEVVKRMKVLENFAQADRKFQEDWTANVQESEEKRAAAKKKRDEIDALVAKNIEERNKALEAGDKKRADAANKRAEAARKLREADDEADARAATELAFAEAENERLNAEQALLDLREQTNQMIDETHIRLQDEMEVRHLEQQLRADMTEEEKQALEDIQQLEKDLFAIRISGMSEEEKGRAKRIVMLGVELKKGKEIEKQDKAEAERDKAIYKATMDATANVGKAALDAAGLSNAATATESAIKAAYYTGESIAEFAAFNIPSGIGFAAAAAQHAIVAGGALAGGVGGMTGGGGKGGGGGGGGPQERLTSGLPATATTGPRETGMTVNVNTLSYVSPEDARRIGQAEAREATSTVGGRK